ncbi:putative Cysteine-rich venom protein natrin-2 [Hypsibius exemplaris]|uniref:Cysteine-rich venom protein natrin-2 n=1 Tax=Hypsibius exemplaris TaxID=2072580 RepID=A0A9X6NJH1_HYPEX|nr:putative Cysteine-rich venom protein natrin-2 [Hypsibius exemplaris]
MAAMRIIAVFVVVVSLYSTSADYYGNSGASQKTTSTYQSAGVSSTTPGLTEDAPDAVAQAPDKGGDDENATEAPPPAPAIPDGCSHILDATCAANQKVILKTINAVRRGVKAADMLVVSWSPAAAVLAQKVADNCGGPAHDANTDRPGCGQNSASGSENSFPNGWPDVFQLWDGEVADFVYGAPDAQCTSKGVIGHYAQDVWASSNTIGCGFALCSDGVRMTCNYCPPGNYRGRKCTPYLEGTDENGGICGKCGGEGSATCPDGLCTQLLTSSRLTLSDLQLNDTQHDPAPNKVAPPPKKHRKRAKQ